MRIEAALATALWSTESPDASEVNGALLQTLVPFLEQSSDEPKTAVATLLIDAGADVNARDNQAHTPLAGFDDHHAHEFPKLVALLTARGAAE